MLNARRPNFLQVFHPNVCSDRLKVPEKFIKHLEGKTRGSVLLIGPSGNFWDINLSMHNDELFLDDGWATFVKDHSIECGDSFVFRYDGDLHFSVQIFDHTSCEKEVAFYAKHSDARLIGRKRERGRKPVPSNAAYSGSQRKTRSINSPAYSECETSSKEWEMDKQDHQLSCSSLKEKVSMASRKAVVMAMSSHGNVQTETRTRQGKPKATMEKSNISTFIEQKVTEYFASQFPYFVRVMKASNVSSSATLKLPVQFSTKHLPNCRTNVILKNLEGDSWTLSSVPTVRVQTMHTLCGGWTSFVRDNGIKMEDICIFELVGDCEMRVRVMKLGMEGLDCEGLKGGISGCAVASPYFASKKNESVRGNPKGRNQAVKRSLMNSNGRGITAAKSTDGSSAAESFTSPFPNFIKVMKISNISGPYTMNIPSIFATAHFPSCRTEIILRNLKGECWTVNSYPSSIRCTAHTLCGGWMAFVRENDINLGDTCVFELVGKEELQVHIFKNGQRTLESRNSDALADSTVNMDSTGCTDLFNS